MDQNAEGTLNIEACIEKLLKCTPLTECDVKGLCNKAKEVLGKESNVQPV